MSKKINTKSIVKFQAIEEACNFFKKHNEKQLLEFAFNEYMRSFSVFYNNINQNYREKNKKEIKKKLINDAKRVYKEYIKQINYPKKKKLFYSLIIKVPDKLRTYVIHKFITNEGEKMKIKIDVKKIFIYLLFIVYLKPFNISLVPMFDTGFKIMKVFLTLILIVLFLKGNCKLSKISIICILFLSIWSLSIVMNSDTLKDQLQEILTILGIIILAELIIQKEKDTKDIFHALYNISAMYIVLQLITIIMKKPLFGIPKNTYDIYFLGGDNLSAFILIPLCGILFANDYKDYSKIRFRTWIIAFCGWACLIIPFAVTGIVAYGIFIFLTLCMNIKIVKKYITPRNIFIIISAFVIGVIFFNIQKYLAPITVALGKGDSTSLLGYRDIIWKDAFDVFKDNWLIGIGSLTTEQIQSHILVRVGHAHNIIMEYLMSTGVLGTSLLFMWIYKILTIKTKKESKQTRTLINCLTAFLCCSVFDFYIGLIYFYLLISLIYIMKREDIKDEEDMHTVC